MPIAPISSSLLKCKICLLEVAILIFHNSNSSIEPKLWWTFQLCHISNILKRKFNALVKKYLYLKWKELLSIVFFQRLISSLIGFHLMKLIWKMTIGKIFSMELGPMDLKMSGIMGVDKVEVYWNTYLDIS